MPQHTKLRRWFTNCGSRGFLCWLVRFCGVVVAALPLIVLARLVIANAVNVPIADDFENTSLMVKARCGGLTLHDFTYLHIDHRLVISRLFLAANAAWFDGDLRNIMGVTLAVAAATSLNLFLLLRHSVRSVAGLTGIMFVINCLIFSPVQWQTWLWGMQLCYQLPVFFMSLMLVIFCSKARLAWRLTLGMGCAVCASCSLGNGLLVWAAAVPMLLVLPVATERGKRLKICLLWILGALATAALYLTNFKNVADPSHSYGSGSDGTLPQSIAYALQNSLQALEFIAVLVGAPFARGYFLHPLSPSFWFGLALLTLMGACLVMLIVRRNRDEWLEATPWLCLVLFGVATAGLMMISRLALGQERQALVPRYVTFALIIPAGLAGVLAILGRRQVWPQIALTALAVTTLPGWVMGAQMMELWRSSRLQAKAALCCINVLPLDDSLNKILDWNLDYAKRQANRLNDAGLLDPPLLKDRRLKNFTVSTHAALGSFAAITRQPDGMFVTGGEASCGGRRRLPADGILLTFRASDGERVIFKLITPRAVSPLGLFPASSEYQLTSFKPIDLDTPTRWTGIFSPQELPGGIHHVEAWVLDATTMRVYALGAEQQVNNELPAATHPAEQD